MKAARSKYLSVMVIPDDNSATYQFRVRTSWLRAGAISAAIFLGLVFLGAVSYWKVATVALDTRRVAERNRQLERENTKVMELAAVLERNREADSQIRKIAGGVIDFSGTGGGYAPVEPAGIEHTIRERIGTRLITEDDDGRIDNSTDRLNSAVTARLFTWPVHGGWITKEYAAPGPGNTSGHSGIDIAAKVGTPVKAAANGVVTFAGWTSDLGNIIILDHGNGYLTRYGHNSRVLVEKGDIINQGKIIAFVGNSGRSSAPHLHFEICKDGVAENPRDFLLR